MKQIEPESLYEILSAQRLRYIALLLELKRQLFKNEAFANESESCFALVTQYPYGPGASFTGYDPAFFKELLRRYPKLDFSLALPPGIPSQVKRMRGLKQNSVPSACFAYEGEAPAAPVDPHIRLLAKEEFDLLRPVADRQDDINYAEKIFVWSEGTQIAGYLCCSPDFDDLWDVNYIFTLPEHRGRGIGTALAYAYLKTMREQGIIPCYSGVTNPASAAAARKAGFQPCSVSYAFKYKRPKFIS